MKRIFDIISSLFGLILLSPFMIIIAILIKLDSKGPIFFKQVRVTKNGREFLEFCKKGKNAKVVLKEQNSK